MTAAADPAAPTAAARAGVSSAADANALLESLYVAMGDRAALLRWCVEHAGDGDPVPAAWAAGSDDPTRKLAAARDDGEVLRLRAALRAIAALPFHSDRPRELADAVALAHEALDTNPEE